MILYTFLNVVRRADRGAAGLMRTAPLEANDGSRAVNLLAARQSEATFAVHGLGAGRRKLVQRALSPEAKAARAPLPPASLVGRCGTPGLAFTRRLANRLRM